MRSIAHTFMEPHVIEHLLDDPRQRRTAGDIRVGPLGASLRWACDLGPEPRSFRSKVQLAGGVHQPEIVRVLVCKAKNDAVAGIFVGGWAGCAPSAPADWETAERRLGDSIGGRRTSLTKLAVRRLAVDS